ncbi:MAG: Type I transmembrane sorting receptor [Pycnora praestabilis]|nr:MAG: Type I transmembrane sorting receptor [Pycnora praestabilis]
MHLLSQISFASAVFSSAVFTMPVENQKRDGPNTFTVQQEFARYFIKNGPTALSNTYLKYNKQLPADVASAAANNDGTVTATPEQYDEEYLCPVTIGGQTLSLDFDTGSSDLWVFSSELPSSEQTGHTIYTPSKSPTFKSLSGYTWDISYGDGSGASGNVGTDTVQIGATTVTNQAVEPAESVSSTFVSDTQSDGLVGLAMSSINTVQPVQQKTFFDNAKASLASPLFTANLKHNAPGNYNFGYIDSSEYAGSITYVPVNTANGFWEFTSNGYAIGSGSFVSDSIDAIADTGTTLLLLDQNIVTAYYAKVSGAKYDNTQGGYTFSCSATLPSITLGIGSYKAVVPGSLINFAPVSGNTCFGGLQANTGIGFSIFGDIFFKSQFVVFEGTSAPQLGFAAKK